MNYLLRNCLMISGSKIGPGRYVLKAAWTINRTVRLYFIKFLLSSLIARRWTMQFGSISMKILFLCFEQNIERFDSFYFITYNMTNAEMENTYVSLKSIQLFSFIHFLHSTPFNNISPPLKRKALHRFMVFHLPSTFWWLSHFPKILYCLMTVIVISWNTAFI